MRIKEITNQMRRDFSAVMICEGCGHEQKLCSGYDDRNYHDNVIPAQKCEACGESRNSLGLAAAPTATRYAEWQVV